LAVKTLEGVGSRFRGHWHEDSQQAQVHHYRKRLSQSEAQSIGEVADLRGTPEGHNRASAFLTAVIMHPAYNVMEKAVREEMGLA